MRRSPEGKLLRFGWRDAGRGDDQPVAGGGGASAEVKMACSICIEESWGYLLNCFTSHSKGSVMPRGSIRSGIRTRTSGPRWRKAVPPATPDAKN